LTAKAAKENQLTRYQIVRLIAVVENASSPCRTTQVKIALYAPIHQNAAKSKFLYSK
jgi:hypothetical protein